MLKFAISSTSLNFSLKISSQIFPLKGPRNCSDWRGKQLRVRRHQSRPAGPLRWLGRKIFFCPIKSGDFKRFWNWFGKSNCPGVRLVLTVNFRPRPTFAHENPCYPTNCPWVSEDGQDLGVHVSRDLSWSNHVDAIVNKTFWGFETKSNAPGLSYRYYDFQ